MRKVLYKWVCYSF